MRTLEHRRHSRRDPGALRLNARGRVLARGVGAELPRFDRVVTSPKPRAVETAEAMGRTVDTRLAALGEMPEEIGRAVDAFGARTFADYLALVERNEEVAGYAADQSALWRAELERVPDGGNLLLISHGGLIKLGAVSALGETARNWGPPLGYVEGVRLTAVDRQWSAGQVIRVRA
ncbi:MAG: histidine phosphatase family protein [Thermoplasmata archaeon]